MLEVGAKAPDFTLPDKEGKPVRLSDFLGQKVVLYFYPRDNTAGCTRQACAFGAAYSRFQAKNVAVIGVSKDTVASHQKFAAKHELPFLLLSDPEHQVIEAYDVWKEKNSFFGMAYPDKVCFNGSLVISVFSVLPVLSLRVISKGVSKFENLFI